MLEYRLALAFLSNLACSSALGYLNVSANFSYLSNLAFLSYLADVSNMAQAEESDTVTIILPGMLKRICRQKNNNNNM